MLNDHTTIRSTAVFDLVGPPNPPVPVQVEMRYDTRDPYAVQAAFRTGRAGWVEWVFSRDLLTEGLLAPAGAGDVRIRPAEHDAESVEIELSSPSGHATFRATSREVSDFLTRTHEIVAPGSEDDWLDLEHALGLLLSSDPSGRAPPPRDERGARDAVVFSSSATAGRTHETRRPHADVAQLVAHHLAKVRVAGSSPVVRSRRLLGFVPR
jgi:hypothetical protein